MNGILLHRLALAARASRRCGFSGRPSSRLGLFASFTRAVTIAFVGGQPAMISVATGAIVLTIAPLVASHGMNYFIAAVILSGIPQVILGVSGVARLMRFIPRSVTVRFVNALGILMFMSQVSELLGQCWPEWNYPSSSPLSPSTA